MHGAPFQLKLIYFDMYFSVVLQNRPLDTTRLPGRLDYKSFRISSKSAYDPISNVESVPSGGYYVGITLHVLCLPSNFNIMLNK